MKIALLVLAMVSMVSCSMAHLVPAADVSAEAKVLPVTLATSSKTSAQIAMDTGTVAGNIEQHNSSIKAQVETPAVQEPAKTVIRSDTQAIDGSVAKLRDLERQNNTQATSLAQASIHAEELTKANSALESTVEQQAKEITGYKEEIAKRDAADAKALKATQVQWEWIGGSVFAAGVAVMIVGFMYPVVAWLIKVGLGVASLGAIILGFAISLGVIAETLKWIIIIGLPVSAVGLAIWFALNHQTNSVDVFQTMELLVSKLKSHNDELVKDVSEHNWGSLVSTLSAKSLATWQSLIDGGKVKPI